jgi:thiamine biosynthesis lipoprotein
MKKIAFLLLLSVLGFMACQSDPERKLVVYSGRAQGTSFQIKFYSAADSVKIMSGIDSIFQLIDYTASIYDSNTIISKVNADLPTELNEHFVTIFNKSQEVSKATDGFFDITVAPLVKAWGFWRKKGMDLSPKQIDSLKAYVDYRKVSISGGKLLKINPGMMIDFNAIAQGYTDDVIADYLTSKGCKDFLIEIGGEVLAKGLKNGKDKWVVGIEKPAADANSEQVLQERIAFTDKALATSGSTRKYIIKDGLKYSHTIDPKTGYPTHQSLLCVTVMAAECAMADAYATAFMVMGKEKSKAILAKHPEMDAYFISADSAGGFVVDYTKGFESLIVK